MLQLPKCPNAVSALQVRKFPLSAKCLKCLSVKLASTQVPKCIKHLGSLGVLSTLNIQVLKNCRFKKLATSLSQVVLKFDVDALMVFSTVFSFSIIFQGCTFTNIFVQQPSCQSALKFCKTLLLSNVFFLLKQLTKSSCFFFLNVNDY